MQLSWNLASLACLGIISLPSEFLKPQYFIYAFKSPVNLTILTSSVSKSGCLYKYEMYEKIIKKKLTSPAQLQVLLVCGVNLGAGEIFRTRPDRP